MRKLSAKQYAHNIKKSSKGQNRWKKKRPILPPIPKGEVSIEEFEKPISSLR
jgi:hypothetical protein